MKKYTILVLTVILASVFMLSGCNKSATASNKFAKYENYTYTAYQYTEGSDTPVAVGTLTLTVALASYEAINWGDGVPAEYNTDKFDGTKVIYHLALDNGDTIDSISYFKNDAAFNPYCSHKTVNIHSSGVNRDQSVYTRFDYSKRNIQFFYNVNGEEQKALKCGKSKVADSESLYTMIRTYDMSSNLSLSYVVPDYSSNAARNISVAKSTDSNVKLTVGGVESEYAVYNVAFSLNDNLKGVSYLVSYAKEDIKYNGVSLVRVPLVIREYNMEYRLSSINAASK